MKALLLLLLTLLLVPAGRAHPPPGAKTGPSKADPFLKQAQAAKKKGDTRAYAAAMLAAKKILAEEGRFSCCIKGGCEECAREGNCGCGANLFAKKGICKECLDGIHAGHGRYTDGVTPDLLFEAPMEMTMMQGALGPWSMNREGSGTTWLPDSSPLYGTMQPRGAWQLMQQANAAAGYVASGGKRGAAQLYGASHYMLMGQKRETQGGVLGLRGMVSLDPLTNGQKGYPNLFQTGETAHGRPLQDRQHPHDLLMELAATYSAPLGGTQRAFVYVAPAGEPALGPAAFPHRPSAWDNPVAPISHHWLDGTHITYGVATAGLTVQDRWKLEASLFNGREPGENRYDIDPIRLNSTSVRLTHNPTRDLSLQVSYGFLKAPEAREPGVDQHRLTLSVMHNRAFENGDNLASMVALGQNHKPGGTTTALLAETAYTRGKRTYFARWDRTQKDELVGVPAGTYRVEKLSLGGVHNLRQDARGQQGIGVSVDLFSYPAALRPDYGRDPVSLTVFYRWRFGKM